MALQRTRSTASCAPRRPRAMAIRNLVQLGDARAIRPRLFLVVRVLVGSERTASAKLTRQAQHPESSCSARQMSLFRGPPIVLQGVT
eukprot:1374735-Pleurochrysis_carterae.AAC.2